MLYDTIGRKESEWAGMTASQIRGVGEQPGSVLVIPVGSVEQHGNHLPVVTDTLLVEAMVDTAVERLDDVPVVVTPPIWSGFSPHHLSFGGTCRSNSHTYEQRLRISHTLASRTDSTRCCSSMATAGTVRSSTRREYRGRRHRCGSTRNDVLPPGVGSNRGTPNDRDGRDGPRRRV